MEKIPTTEEIMIPYFLCDNEDKDLIKLAMIEFAKMHVEQALKEASKKAHIQMDEHDLSCSVNKNSILNSYSLDNIK